MSAFALRVKTPLTSLRWDRLFMSSREKRARLLLKMLEDAGSKMEFLESCGTLTKCNVEYRRVCG